jgi:hypothetical protein
MSYPKQSVIYAASPSTDSGLLSATSGTSGYASLDDFEQKDLVSFLLQSFETVAPLPRVSRSGMSTDHTIPRH